MSEKALKLIQPVSKRDQVVASFKEAILRGVIQSGDAIVESYTKERKLRYPAHRAHATLSNCTRQDRSLASQVRPL